MKKTILLNFAVILATNVSAPAATRLVPDEHTTIQAAIDNCNDGDVVIVAPGTYTGDGNRDIDFRGKAITVRSTEPNDPDIVAATVIDCNGTADDPHRGFYFSTGEDSNSILEGFTVAKGYADGGGAVYCEESCPTISNCIIRDNTVHARHGSNGGGICCYKSDAIISHCTIVDNTAHAWNGIVIANGHGAGIYCREGSPTVMDCVVTNNTGHSGICCAKSEMMIWNCTVSNNTGNGIIGSEAGLTVGDSVVTGNLGSGICNDEGTLIVRNCRISGNRGDRGGGILCDGDLKVISSTISDNESEAYGGGIFCWNGNCRITDSTIIGNIANNPRYWDGGGGGVCCGGGILTVSDSKIIKNSLRSRVGRGGGIYTDESIVKLENCVIYGNYSSCSAGGLYSIRGDGLTIEDCLISGNRAPCNGGGIYCSGTSATLANCVLSGNTAGLNGGGVYCSGDMTISNCTLSSNVAQRKGGWIYCTSYLGCDVTVNNSILFGDVIEDGKEICVHGNYAHPITMTITFRYSNVRGGHGRVHLDDPRHQSLNWGPGNINTEPFFANVGYWDPNETPADANDDFWVDGDYHLKSQAGRWDASTADWVQDDVTSPCIDAGDPSSPIGFEQFPNGGVINMGAYGGTAEASKSYFGKPVCETIVAGDINGDCKVDSVDFAIMAFNWLEKK